MTKRIRLPTICICLSVMAHFLLLFQLEKLGSYNFATPVNLLQSVIVDLESPRNEAKPARNTVDKAPVEEAAEGQSDKDDSASPTPAVGVSVDSQLQKEVPAYKVSQDQHIPADKPAPPPLSNAISDETLPMAIHKTLSAHSIVPPLRTSGEFLSSDSEKIHYRVSLLGVPVGGAELEAKKENDQVRISLRVSSNPVIASIYPVDDLIETRHIGGNFIISTIRQQEGNFKSNRGFTIFLRDKNVFWIDRLTNRSVREPIPNSDVVDLLSGFYYLRNRPLMVGSTETLQIYDSDRYTELPVDILRREKIILPGLRQVDTLVIQPKLTTEGIFRRTGEVLIWVTDDKFRVPVKFVTSIALGQVTAELVSSDVQRQGTVEVGK